MAASIIAAQTRLSPSIDIDITRLYRAHVTAADWREPEVTAFVEASGPRMACAKIAGAIAALELRKPEEVAERIYNCTPAAELIDEGLSDDHALRLFECGWSGNQVIAWIESPLVLTRDPAPLLHAWARIPRPSTEVGHE